ncbi:MAG TPA: TrmH family RNA methyltransferase [Phycisphaeraceae bacterium]
MLRITSTSNARVKQVVRLLREHRHRRATGLFIAEGWRQVSRAAQTLPLRQLWSCPSLWSSRPDAAEIQAFLQDLPSAVERFEVPDAIMRKMAYLREPEGLLAVVEQPRWSLEQLPAVSDQTLYLVAAGIEKPGNLGAMARTAYAAGCQALLTAGAPVDAFNPNAIRASTCAVFCLPVIAAPEHEVLDDLTARGVRIVAATPQAAVPYTDAGLTGPLALAVGAEDRGLSQPWLEAADRTGGQRVVIPMRPGVVDSLNASVAAAILLFESRRQRSVADGRQSPH